VPIKLGFSSELHLRRELRSERPAPAWVEICGLIGWREFARFYIDVILAVFALSIAEIYAADERSILKHKRRETTCVNNLQCYRQSLTSQPLLPPHLSFILHIQALAGIGFRYIHFSISSRSLPSDVGLMVIQEDVSICGDG
jgi:hypothetical protein